MQPVFPSPFLPPTLSHYAVALLVPFRTSSFYGPTKFSFFFFFNFVYFIGPC